VGRLPDVLVTIWQQTRRRIGVALPRKKAVAAAIQKRNGSYRMIFRHRGKQHNFTIGRVSEAEAKAKTDQVEYLLMRLDRKLLSLPPGADIVVFVRRDGTIPAIQDATSVPTRFEPTLADLRDRYLETHGNGTLEHHTLRGIRPLAEALAMFLASEVKRPWSTIVWGCSVEKHRRV
jgi:hypothetical protein